jgi:Na+/proline symporter
MYPRLPPLLIILGLAGLLPFLIFGLASVGFAAARPQDALAALIGYGAVTLSFLGAVHWGLVLGEAAPKAERPRLLLGIVPALLGWLALLLPLVLPADSGLAVLIVGFIAAIVVEDQGRRRDLVPPAYVWLRWGLSVVVVAVLVTVLVLRLTGARIIL